MAYVAIPAAGGSVTTAQLATLGVEPTWASLRHPAIRAIAPTLTRVRVLNTTNTSEDWEVNTATTTGRAIPATDENGGVLVIKSGTTAGGQQTLRTRDAVATNPAYFISNQKTQPWAIAMRVKVTTAMDSAAIVRIMALDTAVTSVQLAIIGTTSTTQFVLRENVGPTIVNTTQAFDTNVYHDCALVFDTTTLWLVYDDVKNTNGMSTLTNFDTGPGYVSALATNGATAANREFRISEAAVYTPSPG